MLRAFVRVGVYGITAILLAYLWREIGAVVESPLLYTLGFAAIGFVFVISWFCDASNDLLTRGEDY